MRSWRPEPAVPASGSASGPVRPCKTKPGSRPAQVRAWLASAGQSPSAATPQAAGPLPALQRNGKACHGFQDGVCGVFQCSTRLPIAAKPADGWAGQGARQRSRESVARDRFATLD
jgi:hypothetical protein